MEPNRQQPTDPNSPPQPQIYQPSQPTAPPPVTQVMMDNSDSSSHEIADPGQVVSNPEGSDSRGTLTAIAGGFTAILGALFSWIIFPIIIVLLLHNFVFQAYHVLGTSMYPTLKQSDYLIVSKVGDTESEIGRIFGSKKVYIPARGQIIVFHYPEDTTKVFVKRVVGLPGDRVVIQNGTVTIYNTANPKGFQPDLGYEPAGTQTLIDTDETVAPGNLFMMGDNRTPGGSFDSREWGQLPSSYIIGNAVVRLLPLGSAKIF